MLYVSFVEIFIKGTDALVSYYGESSDIGSMCFLGGIVLIGIIDALIPHADNPHEFHNDPYMTGGSSPSAEMLQMKERAHPENNPASKNYSVWGYLRP